MELVITRDLIWRDVYGNIFGQPVLLYVLVLAIVGTLNPLEKMEKI